MVTLVALHRAFERTQQLRQTEALARALNVDLKQVHDTLAAASTSTVDAAKPTADRTPTQPGGAAPAIQKPVPGQVAKTAETERPGGARTPAHGRGRAPEPGAGRRDLERDAAEARGLDAETAADAAADRAAEHDGAAAGLGADAFAGSEGLDGVATVVEYDSDARRSQLEQRAVKAGVDPDAAAGRARAAASQARPAQEATAAKGAAKKGAASQQRRGRGASRLRPAGPSKGWLGWAAPRPPVHSSAPAEARSAAPMRTTGPKGRVTTAADGDDQAQKLKPANGDHGQPN